LCAWPRVSALRPSFETLASQAPQDEVGILHRMTSVSFTGPEEVVSPTSSLRKCEAILLVSRTRCSVLHNAPQSRDPRRCGLTQWTPDQQRTASRCAASGARIRHPRATASPLSLRNSVAVVAAQRLRRCRWRSAPLRASRRMGASRCVVSMLRDACGISIPGRCLKSRRRAACPAP